MAQPSQRTDGWPTILWISWRDGDGDTERLEPLCRLHREHVFRDYPASAHGLGRRGDHCTMCRGVLRARDGECRQFGTVLPHAMWRREQRVDGTERVTAPPARGARPGCPIWSGQPA
jgi:hypothetical protein